MYRRSKTSNSIQNGSLAALEFGAANFFVVCSVRPASTSRPGSQSPTAYAVNTWYLHTHGSRLVNVRLDEDRLRKARILREQGLALSDVIREAIDERFEKLNPSTKASDIRKVVQRVFERYPDPASVPQRVYDVHDRKAAGAAIIEKLRCRAR